MTNKYIDRLFSLDGRVALVTGASSGIGQHMATVLAHAGANVVGVARRAEALQDFVNNVAYDGGRAEAIVADLAGEADWPAFTQAVSAPFGAPDIIVNAAGFNPRMAAEDISEKMWSQTLHLNLTVPFLVARAMVAGMRDKGHGNIINIASLQSYRAFGAGIAYGAAKGGITQLTRAMAEEWATDGICVNAIAPGFFPTALTATVFKDAEMVAHHANATMFGRNGVMADLDGITVFLASRSAGYITGQTIGVEGGYLSK